MSIFVTQSIESSVAVLVFARPSPAVELLRASLQEKHLDVLVVDPLFFSQGEADLLESQFFYKTCWIFDDSIKGTPQADLVFQFVYQRQEPVIILTSTLGTEDVNRSWQEKKAGDTALLHHFKKNLPAAKIFVAINWFDQPSLIVSPISFFTNSTAATLQLKSGVETKDVMSHLVKAIIRPHQQDLEDIAKARVFTESEVAGFLPKIDQSSSQRTPKRSVGRVTHTSSMIPPAANPYQELVDFEVRHREVDVRVYPMPSPRIVNRQRQYEQNITRIKQRTQKQRLLHPVPAQVRLPAVSQPPQLSTGELQPLEKHLEVTIQQLFGSQRQVQRAERMEQKVSKTVRVKKKQVRQKRVMILLGVLIFFGVVSGSLVGSFVLMRTTLFNLIVSQAVSENLADQAVWQSWKTKTLVDVLATEIQAYQLVGGVDSLPETAAVVSAVRQMQTIHQQRQELQQLSSQSSAQILGKSPGDVFETITALAAQQQTLYSSLSVIQTQLQAISTEFLSNTEQQAVEKILTEVQQARKQVATFEQLQQLLPGFLAQNERRRIGFVLLDSQELRPSGGTISGVYLVTLEKGTVIDQQFFTPEQIEGDKSGLIPAPAEYKKYLSPATLPLVDAGWGPDFTDTVTIVNGLLDHSLGRKADLLVGITTNTLHSIVSGTGPIALDKTNETITSKNFFERVESHTESDYLQTIFVTLMERLLSDPNQANVALSTISNGFQSGQSFLVSAQPTENDVLNSLGWAGQVSTPQCPSQLGSEKCQISTIYQLESNVGLNKVGSLIKRSIQHTVQIGKDQIRHKRLMTFTNESSSSRWPSGPYKNYLRLYLPQDAEVSMIRVGDTILDPKSVDQSKDKGRQVVGFLVEVPIRSSVQVSVEYHQKFTYSSGSGFAFFDQKQAGTQPDDYTLVLSPQDGLQAGVVAPKAELKNGQIIFKANREKHQFVGVKFR